MLFDEFIKQYVEDLIECSDKKYNLTDEDKKRLIEDLRYDDYLWEMLDGKINNWLEDNIDESE